MPERRAIPDNIEKTSVISQQQNRYMHMFTFGLFGRGKQRTNCHLALGQTLASKMTCIIIITTGSTRKHELKQINGSREKNTSQPTNTQWRAFPRHNFMCTSYVRTYAVVNSRTTKSQISRSVFVLNLADLLFTAILQEKDGHGTDCGAGFCLKNSPPTHCYVWHDFEMWKFEWWL